MGKYDVEEIIRKFESGKTYQQIATEIGESRNSIIGAVWRHRNPEKQSEYDQARYNNQCVGVHFPNKRVKKDIKNLADREDKSMSAMCLELILAGYKAKYMKK